MIRRLQKSLREKCPDKEFFLVLFSCIRTEYGDLRIKSPYSVQIQENTDWQKLRIWTLLTQWISCDFKFTVFKFINLRLEIAVKELVDSESACINDLIITLNLQGYCRIWTVGRSTIILIIFWDFLMFYQIFLSPPVKRCVITTYKQGIYELPHELPNDLRL